MIFPFLSCVIWPPRQGLKGTPFHAVKCRVNNKISRLGRKRVVEYSIKRAKRMTFALNAGHVAQHKNLGAPIVSTTREGG